MSFSGDAERRATYWFERFEEERRKNRALLAENKKAKERQLAATRLALKYKSCEKAIREISKAENESQDYEEFGDRVISVLRGLGYVCD